MLHEPWRYTCPNGHRATRQQQNGDWYCDTCNGSYPATQITDLKLEGSA